MIRKLKLCDPAGILYSSLKLPDGSPANGGSSIHQQKGQVWNFAMTLVKDECALGHWVIFLIFFGI